MRGDKDLLDQLVGLGIKEQQFNLAFCNIQKLINEIERTQKNLPNDLGLSDKDRDVIYEFRKFLESVQDRCISVGNQSHIGAEGLKYYITTGRFENLIQGDEDEVGVRGT